MAEAGRRCPAFRTVGGSSLIRFGLDVSQKKRPFASSTMIAADYSVASAINRDSVAANEYSPVREERDDAPTWFNYAQSNAKSVKNCSRKENCSRQ
jgi:hypothetical protein